MSLENVKKSSGIKEAISESIDIILNHGTEVYDSDVINKLKEYKTAVDGEYNGEKLVEVRDYLRALGK